MDRLVTNDDVHVGQPTQKDIYDPSGTLLLRKGSIIESELMIDGLLTRGALFHADLAPNAPSHLHVKKSDASPFESMEALCGNLKTVSFNSDDVVNFVGSLRSIAFSLINTVERDPDSSIASIFLNIGLSYAIRHEIHSAILAVIMAKEMGVPRHNLISLVCAALTMNLSFLEYQDNLNARSGGLTDDEREMISKHPEMSCEMLMFAKVVDPLWLECVLHHHEQWDGSGYPGHLAGNDIPLLAQILQMVDMFSARISVRSWGQKELANATMADLLRSTAGNKCNPELIKALIKSLGAFPPGSHVQLANDETAIVVHRGTSATTPIVFSLTCRGLQLGSPIRRDTSVDRYAIKALLPHATIDAPLRLQTLWANPLL